MWRWSSHMPRASFSISPDSHSLNKHWRFDALLSWNERHLVAALQNCDASVFRVDSEPAVTLSIVQIPGARRLLFLATLFLWKVAIDNEVLVYQLLFNTFASFCNISTFFTIWWWQSLMQVHGTLFKYIVLYMYPYIQMEIQDSTSTSSLYIHAWQQLGNVHDYRLLHNTYFIYFTWCNNANKNMCTT